MPFGIAVTVERDAFGDARFGAAHELVEVAARLARVARDFGHAFLVIVELLENRDRHVEIVFLEAEEAGGVVHQHIGVEHEKLGGGGRKTGDVRSGLTLNHEPPEAATLDITCPGF